MTLIAPGSVIANLLTKECLSNDWFKKDSSVCYKYNELWSANCSCENN